MAYRRTPKIEERMASRRMAIIQAVRRVAAEVGFRDAQITRIAAAAGVATGTVYLYFQSKTELFSEAVKVNTQHEYEIVRAAAEREAPPLPRLAAAISTFAIRAVRARRLAYAMMAEPVDIEVEQTRLDYGKAFAALFRSCIDEGIALGELPEQDSAAAAACVFGALVEGLIGPLAPDASHETEETELVRTILRFCLRAVGATEPAVQQAIQSVLPEIRN